MPKKVNHHTYREYLHYANLIKPHSVAVQAALAIVTLLQGYVAVTFLGLLVSQLTRPNVTVNQLWPITAGFLGIIFGLAVLGYWLNMHAQANGWSAWFGMQAMTNKKMLTVTYPTFIDPKFRDNYAAANTSINYSGGFATFITEIVNSVCGLLVAVLLSGASLVALFGARSTQKTTLAQFANSPWLLILTVFIIAIPVVAAFPLAKLSGRFTQKFYQYNIQFNRIGEYYIQKVFEDYSIGKVIRIFDPHDHLVHHFGEMNRTQIKQDNKLLTQATAVRSLNNIVLSVIVGALYVVVGIKGLAGAISIGAVIAYVGYLQQVISALTTMMDTVGTSAATLKGLDQFIDFIEYPDAPATGKLPVEKRLDNEYAIKVDDVSFRYPGAKAWSLRHVTMDFKVGQRLALVGPNGSGKTTLIKLLTRLAEPTEGHILLNGIDIQKYDIHEYQQIFAVVFQDYRLFAFSVADNVAVNTHKDPARMKRALTLAGVWDKVQTLPKQADTSLTKNIDPDGVDISGGEAQKIAIARAWYKDAPFIILDEPTAALDPVSEYEIYQRFDDLMENKTAIYVSHRMSSTRFSQRIVVLDHGEIVEDGTHESLMQAKGLYYRLFEAQAQYYTSDKIKEERKNADATYAIS
ncbi:ABC transporter ATP-binding protein [Schleiferilactobacillus perolens]|jgi:ABC-type multidrug transport system fused ATPase/permease subunit|uniref:ABC transporter ATP-binding protein n=1 Tax=Schleiferilactobacillus perolens TaxID=100468 RepID=UPI002354DEF9|nr:ABC transporter ATP-binding protein [Schleiferilactobacillus perolens]MCI2171738.1 ABC transporter ATP-binding protein/permease [Schleiferilactobacillus perolens]